MNKLVGNQRKILHCIYKNRKQHLTRFNISDKLSSISNHEISMHLRELLKDNYIFYSGLNDTINLTSKGLSYFKLETQDSIEKVITSIAFPIIVSFTTALITGIISTLTVLWLNNL